MLVSPFGLNLDLFLNGLILNPWIIMKCKTGARFLPNTSIVSFILIRFIGLGVVAKLGPFERKEMLSLER